MSNDNFDWGRVLDQLGAAFERNNIHGWNEMFADKAEAGRNMTEENKSYTRLDYRILKESNGARVIVNIPGRTKEDVSIKVEHDDASGNEILEITVAQKEGSYPDDTEVRFDSITEAAGTLRIPFKSKYDFNGLHASASNGQLYIVIPRSPEAKARTFVIE